MKPVKLEKQMDEHTLSLEVLGRFARQTATSAERKSVVRHLLAGCPQCRTYLTSLWPTAADMARLEELESDDYEVAFERALERAWTAFKAGPGAQGRRLLTELDTHPPASQEMLVRNLPRFWNVELCNALILRSHEARFSSMATMRHQAQLAVLVSEGLSTEPSELGEAADCRARAWTAFGNALRVSGDLNGAEGALATAQVQVRGNDRQRPLLAHILSHFASLRLDQRRFEDSLELIQQAIQIWQQLGNSRELARMLVKQAIVTGESGQPRAAVKILLDAGHLIDSETEPKLALVLMQSIIRFYIDGGQAERALRLFVEARPLYEKEADPLIRIKALWLEGQIMSAERHLEPALKQLSEVREGYLALGNGYEAAIVSLDLAAVLAKLGRFTEMRTLARETVREMKARGVHREAIAALILLQQAATSETALALIRRTAVALKTPARRHRLNDGRPGLDQLFP
jgi:tetratricopeptide (TPR) repeat protein